MDGLVWDVQKIKVSTEGVIDSVQEVDTDLADRTGIGRKSQ